MMVTGQWPVAIVVLDLKGLKLLVKGGSSKIAVLNCRSRK